MDCINSTKVRESLTLCRKLCTAAKCLDLRCCELILILPLSLLFPFLPLLSFPPSFPLFSLPPFLSLPPPPLLLSPSRLCSSWRPNPQVPVSLCPGPEGGYPTTWRWHYRREEKASGWEVCKIYLTNLGCSHLWHAGEKGGEKGRRDLGTRGYHVWCMCARGDICMRTEHTASSVSNMSCVCEGRGTYCPIWMLSMCSVHHIGEGHAVPQ